VPIVTNVTNNVLSFATNALVRILGQFKFENLFDIFMSMY